MEVASDWATALRAVLDGCPPDSRMSDLAARCGMSRSAFAKRFAIEIGVTPMRFMRAARLSRAAKLLRDSSRSVEAIAVLAGYASRSQFYRAFRAQFGMSPSRFREHARTTRLHRPQQNHGECGRKST
jgi:transcriptional regulator GlxA family with amidase domain